MSDVEKEIMELQTDIYMYETYMYPDDGEKAAKNTIDRLEELRTNYPEYFI